MNRPKDFADESKMDGTAAEEKKNGSVPINPAVRNRVGLLLGGRAGGLRADGAVGFVRLEKVVHEHSVSESEKSTS